MNRIYLNNEIFNLLYNNEVLSELIFEYIYIIYIYLFYLYDSLLNIWKKIFYIRIMYNIFEYIIYSFYILINYMDKEFCFYLIL